jgi:hypothetical protein
MKFLPRFRDSREISWKFPRKERRRRGKKKEKGPLSWKGKWKNCYGSLEFGWIRTFQRGFYCLINPKNRDYYLRQIREI